MPRIFSKHQVTLPAEMLELTGLRADDKVTFEARGPGRIVVRRALAQPERALGIFDGLYARGHLEHLRAGERA